MYFKKTELFNSSEISLLCEKAAREMISKPVYWNIHLLFSSDRLLQNGAHIVTAWIWNLQNTSANLKLAPDLQYSVKFPCTEDSQNQYKIVAVFTKITSSIECLLDCMSNSVQQIFPLHQPLQQNFISLMFK